MSAGALSHGHNLNRHLGQEFGIRNIWQVVRPKCRDTTDSRPRNMVRLCPEARLVAPPCIFACWATRSSMSTGGQAAHAVRVLGLRYGSQHLLAPNRSYDVAHVCSSLSKVAPRRPPSSSADGSRDGIPPSCARDGVATSARNAASPASDRSSAEVRAGEDPAFRRVGRSPLRAAFHEPWTFAQSSRTCLAPFLAGRRRVTRVTFRRAAMGMSPAGTVSEAARRSE